MDAMTNSDKAIAILEKTSDGHTLFQTPKEVERHGPNGDGWQLNIVQAAVNNHLNEKGQRLFDKLYEQVMAGDYQYDLDDFTERFLPPIGG